MSLTAVPPHESITPRRKQRLYNFAVETFTYADGLNQLKNSNEFSEMSLAEQEKLNEEIQMLEELNSFQVEEINKF